MEGKRRWFQIRLTTAISTMVLSGPLIWANLQVKGDFYAIPDGVNLNYTGFHSIGWPVPFLEHVAQLNRQEIEDFGKYYDPKDGDVNYWPLPLSLFLSGDEKYKVFLTELSVVGAVLDCAVALCVLGLGGAFAELVARRWDRKQQGPQA